MPGIGAFTSTGFEYVTITVNEKLTLGSESFTVDFWFRSSSIDVGLTASGDETGNWEIRLDSDGKVQARIFGSATVTSDSAYNDDEWHYVRMIVDRGRAQLAILVDLTYKEISLSAGAVTYKHGHLHIAAAEIPIAHFNILAGSIADFRIRKYAALPQPLTALPTCQEGDTSGTILLLHFNDGHGSTPLDVSAGTISPDQVPSHASCVITSFMNDAIHWPNNGPVYAPPLLNARELIAFALDDDQDVLDFVSAHRLFFYRSRLQDQVDQRVEIPQMTLVPLAAGPGSSISHSYGWQTVMTRTRLLVLASPRYSLTPLFIEELEHLLTGALYRRANATGETFGDYHVSKFSLGPIQVESQTMESGQSSSAFHFDINLGFRRDLRNVNQP